MTLSVVKFLITLCLADGPVNNKPSATFWYLMLYIPYTGFLNFLHVRPDFHCNMSTTEARPIPHVTAFNNSTMPGRKRAVAPSRPAWRRNSLPINR